MGSNSQQGWALFAFLVGFTFLPAGLFVLGPIFSIVGLVILVGSLIAFAKIKPVEPAAEIQGSSSGMSRRP